ncbi:MAG: hypothetical protein KJP22_02265 [Acidimicrobiia bacterium]|nr:hypothetical protein [Acidimicrobiia bacterium]
MLKRSLTTLAAIALVAAIPGIALAGAGSSQGSTEREQGNTPSEFGTTMGSEDWDTMMGTNGHMGSEDWDSMMGTNGSTA